MIITFQAILEENIGLVLTKTGNTQGVLIFKRPPEPHQNRPADDYYRINVGKQFVPYMDTYIKGNIYNITIDIVGVLHEEHYTRTFWMLIGIKLVKNPDMYKKWNTELKM